MTSAPRSPETLNVSVQGQVAIVAMNRPEAMNAISMQMRADLRETLETLRRDPDIGAVVLTGNGEGISAGMDLREFAQTNAGMPVAEMKRFRWAQAEGIAAFDKPIIAAVNGVAIGGGLELALLCDLVFAAENATFALRKSSGA